MEAQKLYVTWRSPAGPIVPVGLLTEAIVDSETVYEFAYLHGAKHVDFQPLAGFPDLQKRYKSDQLFPLFSNRLMPRSRPDYPNYMRALSLGLEEEPFTILARSEGSKHTDRVEVFAYPSRAENGKLKALFFARGIRHLPSAADAVDELVKGDVLELRDQPDNTQNPKAILMHSVSGQTVGYVADYLLPTIHELRRYEPCKVLVEHVNDTATPSHMRLLCRLEAPWPDDFSPLSTQEFQPLTAALLEQ